MKKVSIIVDKNLSAGQKSNVAAILTGQLSLSNSGIYAEKVLLDKNGIAHVGITKNIVILDGGKGQLLNLANSLKNLDTVEDYTVFTETGQKLSNSFDEYTQTITRSDSETLGIVGVGIYGETDYVNQLTKKFSLAK